MGELYLRKVVLDVIPATGSAKRIDGLRIKFNIEKTNEKTPNDARIEIFNLSDATRSMLEAKNTRVSLAVGYDGLAPGGFLGTGLGSSSNVASIFVGNVKKAIHERTGADIITKVDAADGGNRYRNSRLDKGFPPNVKLQAVIDEIQAAMELGKGAQEGVPDKSYANGVAFSGLCREHLTELCRANGLEWSIQDESLQIIPAGRAASNSLILLTPDTGLVGHPSKTDKGVEFQALIQPELKPGRKVQVDSRTLKGTFKLRKVTHDGDSNEGEFLSKCEATTGT